jgi:Calcineurin-like phosphoesterase
MKRWTDQESALAQHLHQSGWSAKAIARQLGRTPIAVRMKFLGKNISSARLPKAIFTDVPNPPPASVAPPPISEKAEFVGPEINEVAEQLLETHEQHLERRRQRQQALDEAQRERMLRLFREVLADCRIQFSVAPPPPAAIEHAHSAVLVFGDWHLGKVCNPLETEGRATYSLKLAIARLDHLQREVARLLSGGPPIDELVILFCGDIVEGALDHGAEREETILLGKQFTLALTLLAQFIARLAAVVPRIRVQGVSGNHGRLPNQRKMPTTGRESNIDAMIYAALQTLFSFPNVDARSVTFDLRESSRQLIRIKETWVLLAHGDELRGGDFYVGGIKKEVYNSVLRYAREGRIPDLWITGDKHVSIALPVANGQFMVNGSFVGEDNYSQKFAPAIPSQTLLWICPERGKVLQADIRLDRVTVPPVLPYDLPPLLQALVTNHLN